MRCAGSRSPAAWRSTEVDLATTRVCDVPRLIRARCISGECRRKSSKHRAALVPDNATYDCYTAARMLWAQQGKDLWRESWKARLLL
jgi:hypothetical protein